LARISFFSTAYFKPKNCRDTKDSLMTDKVTQQHRSNQPKHEAQEIPREIAPVGNTNPDDPEKVRWRQESELNRATTDAQTTQAGGTGQYSGGSAMLDATAQADVEPGSQPEVDQATATNFTEAKGTNAPTKAQQINTTSPNSSSLDQLDDEGNFSISKDSPSQ
jgi:hypothetical protein